MLSPRFFCQFLSMVPSGCLFLIGFTRCICWQWTCSNRSSSKSFSSASVPHCLYSHISPRRSFSASKKEASTRLRSSRRWKSDIGWKNTNTRATRSSRYTECSSATKSQCFARRIQKAEKRRHYGDLPASPRAQKILCEIQVGRPHVSVHHWYGDLSRWPHSHASFTTTYVCLNQLLAKNTAP